MRIVKYYSISLILLSYPLLSENFRHCNFAARLYLLKYPTLQTFDRLRLFKSLSTASIRVSTGFLLEIIFLGVSISLSPKPFRFLLLSLFDLTYVSPNGACCTRFHRIVKPFNLPSRHFPPYFSFPYVLDVQVFVENSRFNCTAVRIIRDSSRRQLCRVPVALVLFTLLLEIIIIIIFFFKSLPTSPRGDSRIVNNSSFSH